MTFEEFEDNYFKKLDNIHVGLRKGQILINYLWEVWPEEYEKISSVHYYDRKDIDCFYNDRLIPNTLKHLKEVWK